MYAQTLLPLAVVAACFGFFYAVLGNQQSRLTLGYVVQSFSVSIVGFALPVLLIGLSVDLLGWFVFEFLPTWAAIVGEG